MTQYDWYNVVDPDTPLTQGDLINDCPVLIWKPDETQDLKKKVDAVYADCIVMSQACDLEQNRVKQVILCPNFGLSKYKEGWIQASTLEDNSTSDKSWRSHLKAIIAARMWHLTILEKYDGTLSTEQRIVDFHQIFSIPRDFLENRLRTQNVPRLTLLPPYREYLSQAFARYFMRVGLPNDIEIPS